MTSAILIAHGSPADPEPQERAMQALAARVRLWLPGWQIRGTTLACPGALEAATKALPDALIYPFFMAEGFFTRRQLPKRLATAGMKSPHQLPAFGHDPELPALLARTARAAALTHGLPEAQTTLLLAAHGSQVSRASATITEQMAEALRQATRFHVVTGYVEEDPLLHHAAQIPGPALCLPFFATRAGHVAQDVPQALAEAHFPGPLLPAIGEHPQVAPLIAAALTRATTHVFSGPSFSA